MRSERVNSKIRDAQLRKIPYMLVVGDREAEGGTASVRLRSGDNLGAIALTDVVSRIAAEIDAKA